jgi:hypothetical protein
MLQSSQPFQNIKPFEKSKQFVTGRTACMTPTDGYLVNISLLDRFRIEFLPRMALYNTQDGFDITKTAFTKETKTISIRYINERVMQGRDELDVGHTAVELGRGHWRSRGSPAALTEGTIPVIAPAMDGPIPREHGTRMILPHRDGAGRVEAGHRGEGKDITVSSRAVSNCSVKVKSRTLDVLVVVEEARVR